jgi:hypothetical protein
VLIVERMQHGVSEVPAMMGVLYIKEQPHLKKEKGVVGPSHFHHL